MTLIDPGQIFAASSLTISIVEIHAVCVTLSSLFLRAHCSQVVEICVRPTIIVELVLRRLVLYHWRIGTATRSTLITSCVVISVD
jgi:hypothetical protein